jgi:Uma2 family endonuclease
METMTHGAQPSVCSTRAELRFPRIAEQVMGMALSSRPRRRYTLQEFERLRDAASSGPRYEFLDGEILVTPSPNAVHQRIIVLLTVQLEPFVRANGIGQLLVAPFDVRFGVSRVLQPDLLVRSRSDVESGRRDAARQLRLAVEVVSPTSARYDRVDKRPTYQAEQVDELWLVDPESELVERWTPDDQRPEVVAETLVWRPTGTDQSLSMDLVALFAEAKR